MSQPDTHPNGRPSPDALAAGLPPQPGTYGRLGPPSDRQAMRLMGDHSRIVTELNDHVVQELLAVGLGLQGMLDFCRPEHQARVRSHIDALDATIQDIRRTTFRLHTGQHSPSSLRLRLLAVLDNQTPALGFHPEISFHGPLDQRVPSDLADAIVAIVRETLANIARHARASTAQIHVAVISELVIVDLAHNGSSLGNVIRNNGIGNNIRRAAAAYRGTLEVATPPAGGTHLRWTGGVTEQPVH